MAESQSNSPLVFNVRNRQTLDDVAAALSPIARVEGVPGQLDARFEGHRIDAAVLIGFTMASAALRRDEATRRNHDHDHLLVVHPVAGQLAASVADRTITVESGAFAVFDLARDFHLRVGPEAHGIAVIIPRQLFMVPRGDPGFHGAVFGAKCVAAQLAAAQIAKLKDLAAGEAIDAPAEAVRAIVAALRIVFAPLEHSPAGIVFDRRDRSLLGKMCRHIDTAIDDPALDAAALAKTFAVSRATVYRVFAPHGGVASYIRNIRLDQAFDQIRRSPHKAERLNVLARRFGFSGGDSFARAFQGRFGIRPVQLHSGGLAAIRDANRHRRHLNGGDIGTLEGWLLDIGVGAAGPRQ